MRRETEREREREGDREAATEAKTETVTEPKPCVYACVLVVSSLTCEPTYSFATVRFWPQLCSNHLIQLAHVFGLERERESKSARARERERERERERKGAGAWASAVRFLLAACFKNLQIPEYCKILKIPKIRVLEILNIGDS